MYKGSNLIMKVLLYKDIKGNQRTHESGSGARD